MPVFLQVAKGSSPTLSGLELIPMTVGILGGSTLTGFYMTRTGRYRRMTILGTALMVLFPQIILYLPGRMY